MVPIQFDTQDLLKIVKTQINTQGDHFWLAQTDARYLRKPVASISTGHFNENVIGEMRQDAIARRLMHDVTMTWTWQWILEAVQDIQAFGVIDLIPGRPLPKAYVKALLSVEMLLKDLLRRRILFLYDVLP